MQRTAAVELDQEFQVGGEIVKSWEDEHGRYIRGVASGVEEDRDGERMSKRCISDMVKQINRGKVTLNGLHQDDWLAEMGEVVKGYSDEDTHQLVIDTKLPPEGEDPIADKAWNRMKGGRKLGFSVGGKLRKAFFERNELGKRRKVLDEVALKHIMLTAKPAYQHSFAEAVAKTWEPSEPADDGWFEEQDSQDELFKAAPFAGGDTDSEAGNDSKTGDRNAGSNKKGSSMRTEETKDEEEYPPETAEDEDKQRRLACPNCGHEFAAPLPTDADVGDEEERAEDHDREDNDNHQRAKKSRQERTMPKTVSDALDVIKTFAESLDSETDAGVEKDATEDEVAKTADQRLDELENQLADAFDTIGKTQKALFDSQHEMKDMLQGLPRGRQSVARVLPPRGGEDEVEKSTQERIDEAPDVVSALKVLNASRGIE